MIHAVILEDYRTVSRAEWTYSISEDEFAKWQVDGRVLVSHIDRATKPAMAYYRYTEFGQLFAVPLDVPLCGGCDAHITTEHCNACHLTFEGEAA